MFTVSFCLCHRCSQLDRREELNIQAPLEVKISPDRGGNAVERVELEALAVHELINEWHSASAAVEQ